MSTNQGNATKFFFETSAHLGAEDSRGPACSCIFWCIGHLQEKLIRGKFYLIKKEFLSPKKRGGNRGKSGDSNSGQTRRGVMRLSDRESWWTDTEHIKLKIKTTERSREEEKNHKSNTTDENEEKQTKILSKFPSPCQHANKKLSMEQSQSVNRTQTTDCQRPSLTFSLWPDQETRYEHLQ